MSRSLPTLALGSMLSCTGCSTEFDGTWLFQWDRASEQTVASGVCGDSEDTKSYQGDLYEWIDIYSTTGGALVLTNGEQEWVGKASGSSFTAEATYGENDDGYYYQWNETITGDLPDEDLSGAHDRREIDCAVDDGCVDSDTECRRHTRRSYKAVRMEGTEGALRTIGTQTSQSASSN